MDNYVDYPAMCQLAVSRYNRGDISLSEMRQICSGPTWWDQHGTAVIIAAIFIIAILALVGIWRKMRQPAHN